MIKLRSIKYNVYFFSILIAEKINIRMVVCTIYEITRNMMNFLLGVTQTFCTVTKYPHCNKWGRQMQDREAISITPENGLLCSDPPRELLFLCSKNFPLLPAPHHIQNAFQNSFKPQAIQTRSDLGAHWS